MLLIAVFCINLYPKFVTLSGNLKLFNDVQPENASAPIPVTFSDNSTFVRLIQLLNTYAPMSTVYFTVSL